MVGVPGSSPVAPTRDLENDVGNECRNDAERADGDREHLNGIASKQLIGVVCIFATHPRQIEHQLWQSLRPLSRIVR